MEAKPKTYRYFSTILLLMVFATLIFVPIALLLLAGGINGYGMFFFVLGILSLYGLFTSMYSVVITEDKIIGRRLWGKSILSWKNLERMIPKPNGSFFLLNEDNTTRIFISAQLKGYLELVNIISQKCPGIFSFYYPNHFSRTSSRNILAAITGFLVVVFGGLAIYFVFIGMGRAVLEGNLLFLILLGLFILGDWFFSPQSLDLQESTLKINFFYKAISYEIDDIESIKLLETSALVGNSHPVVIILKTKRLLKISGFKQGPLILYFVLLRWHQNFITNQPA